MRKRDLILLFLMVPLGIACQRQAPAPVAPVERSFDEEFSLTVRAGRSEMSNDERTRLMAEGHPLSAQLADVLTAKLISAFAHLPDAEHETLKATGFVKSKFPGLTEEVQQVSKDIIQHNIKLASAQGSTMQPGFSLKDLENADVGFAVVEIPDSGQKVVSWFVLWPESQPTWVTVVNGRAAGTPSYFQAHLKRLSELRTGGATATPAAETEADNPAKNP